ncbi:MULTISPECIES: hypothetical protein [unclassified Gilliamella]|uniref:hypothetical protein n=1 Tax=unclassified Gilliamella TaxID=2685620 RepID=UPI00226A2767|nr:MULTISPECIES: hypothetical protein [unclassified Gilliamella]MCX8582697.1 hypothetical protein [Gilliamella sp. B3372]MCX8594220.1 hypothetical protein [Gilliamella sp. B3367]
MSRIIKKNNIWYFDDYFDYLNKNEKQIPENTKYFILDHERYLIRGEKTLYDSNFKSLKYSIGIGKKKDLLSIIFTNAFNTKKYCFEFQNVIEIKLNCDLDYLKSSYLLIHQFSINKDNSYKYEFIFTDRSKIILKFKNISIKEEDISNYE